MVGGKRDEVKFALYGRHAARKACGTTRRSLQHVSYRIIFSRSLGVAVYYTQSTHEARDALSYEEVGLCYIYSIS